MTEDNQIRSTTNIHGKEMDNSSPELHRLRYFSNTQGQPATWQHGMPYPVPKKPPKRVKQKPRRKAKRAPTAAELDTGNPVSKPEGLTPDPAIEAAHKTDLKTKGLK